MTKEQALLIVEEKRSWADLISGEKDELYDAIDVVLAENDRLKGEVERLKRLNTSLVYGHDIFKLAALRVESTLRASLAALVTAGEAVDNPRIPELVDNGKHDLDGEPLMEETDCYIVDGEALDALSAAVTQAKGEK